MVAASAAEVEAAESDARALSRRYFPRLTLSERFVRTDEPGGSLFIDLNQERFELSPDAATYNDPPARSNFETRLTLRQPLFDADIKFDRQRADLRSVAASDRHARHREEAVMATLGAYLDVQLAHAQQEWAKQSLVEAEELLSVARQQESAGIGSHADTLRVAVLNNDSQRQVLVAGNAVKTTQRLLALAVGRADGQCDIAGPVRTDLIGLSAEPIAIQRGDLEAMGKTVAAADLAARQKKSAYLPKVGLQASYFRNDGDPGFVDNADAWSVSAGFEWLLFDAGERSQAVAGARARHLALVLQKQEQDRQARIALTEAFQNAEEAVVQLQLAESSLVAAEASRELVSQRYAAGLATLTDLLAVQTELTRVRSELVAAETGRLRACADVYFAQGTLLQALLPEREVQP